MTTVYGIYSYVFDSVDFGIAVREYRALCGMTQLECAELVLKKASPHIISRIENANYDDQLQLDHFIALCNGMDVSPAQFFTMQAT